MDENFFAKCCESAAVDVISVDCTTKGNWLTLTFANVAKAVARGKGFYVQMCPCRRSFSFSHRPYFSSKKGVYFEICCSPAWSRNTSNRSAFFSTMMKLISVCRGKNIIFSQNAQDWDVRLLVCVFKFDQVTIFSLVVPIF